MFWISISRYLFISKKTNSHLTPIILSFFPLNNPDIMMVSFINQTKKDHLMNSIWIIFFSCLFSAKISLLLSYSSALWVYTLFAFLFRSFFTKHRNCQEWRGFWLSLGMKFCQKYNSKSLRIAKQIMLMSFLSQF